MLEPYQQRDVVLAQLWPESGTNGCWKDDEWQIFFVCLSVSVLRNILNSVVKKYHKSQKNVNVRMNLYHI